MPLVKPPPGSLFWHVLCGAPRVSQNWSKWLSYWAIFSIFVVGPNCLNFEEQTVEVWPIQPVKCHIVILYCFVVFLFPLGIFGVNLGHLGWDDGQLGRGKAGRFGFGLSLSLRRLRARIFWPMESSTVCIDFIYGDTEKRWKIWKSKHNPSILNLDQLGARTLGARWCLRLDLWLGD